ncbi:MAG: AAA family ATPase, partial [Thermoanaerobaculaceae bacterium]|nr:AAA family ATPase [Thermoanaerobaculaceae bacterium]TAM44940.1 MAG: ATP-binding protein [Acidobacteriota bacterium]
MARELAASDLRWRCPEAWLPADTTAEVEPSHGIIGQERAVRALEFGLAVESLGFNVFVTGLTGTGRMTAIELHLRPLAAEGAPPDDLTFVYNFAHPEQPRLLRLAAGRAVVLRDQLDKLLRDLSASLPGMFDGDEFQRRLELAVEDLKAKQQELIKGFERRVREAGFTLVQVQVGSVTRPEILPTVEERPVTLDKLQSLAEEGKVDRERAAALEAEHAKLSEELQRVFHEVMVLRDEMVSRAERLRRSSVEPTLKQALGAVAGEVKEPRVGPYLDEMLADMLDHLDLFAAKDGDDGDRFLRYRVNVVVDNGATAGRPVVIETEPSYGNLFGTVEAKVGPDLHSTTDHMRIRAGSLLRANGGFLVVNAFDSVSEAGVWPALKRALRYRRVVIRPRDILFAISGQALQPEPVEIDVKVVMIGDRALYDMLHELDEEFRKIFKVLCDFDNEMPNGREQVGDFLALMAKIVRDEGLPHLDRTGMAALVEEAVRLARNRKRISARFSDVADIVREAAFLAHKRRRGAVTAEHIRAAVRERRDRHSLPEEKLTGMMLDDVLVIASAGSVVGQINGLAVYDLGYHAFGLPGRVTARVGLGREGVINVEREAHMSGSTHDKGVLILTGFLRGTFAAEMPLSMSASIAFEQSYGGVDGDSASSTEVYAILSALSGVAIRQDLAVTGSVDQNGGVQAIGGVNEKIEGFFALCSRRGLSGTQGVLIPEANVADLQLDPEIVTAVESGRFHIYAVARVEEGIALLTGVPAGTRGTEGAYAPDTVLGRCAARLAAMAEQLRRYREV